MDYCDKNPNTLVRPPKIFEKIWAVVEGEGEGFQRTIAVTVIAPEEEEHCSEARLWFDCGPEHRKERNEELMCKSFSVDECAKGCRAAAKQDRSL